MIVAFCVLTTFGAAEPMIGRVPVNSPDDLRAFRDLGFRVYGVEFLHLPPSGDLLTINGMVIFRFSEAQIVECWVQWDTLGFLRAAGRSGQLAVEEAEASTA